MSDSRPNILYIMSDDHTVNAISCYNGWLNEVVDTPNIDRIANEGMRFDNCICNNALCSPSRA
ncbi:MAG: sulfatase-like hydrolase/transferase, partial [Gemmatimonadota bacterium]|nr:sulfatase-like hydrolase/transferase [Gemmatimonadota bacterium]